MSFNAIVHAPRLRVGARVSIARADQRQDVQPAGIGAGAEIRIRFGVCCPDHARGTIIDCERQRATLTVDGESWTLLKGVGGVSTPGLVSEDWFVSEAAA